LTFEPGRRRTVAGVGATLTIGEVAERSGFAASTLRYYEELGLVTPVSRTQAGYRCYDDRALDRLAFIARAKQLGCTLEEIAELAGVWGTERCGPVQRRIHELLTAKLHETERRIAELEALAMELQTVAAKLAAAGPPPDGPCSDACACLAIGAGR
jgi:MerR family transcriptional regulator, copper efflux regulator